MTNRLNTLEIQDEKTPPAFVSEFLTSSAKRLFFLSRDLAYTHKQRAYFQLLKTERLVPILVNSKQKLINLKQKN